MSEPLEVRAYSQGHGLPDRCSVHGDIPRDVSIREHLMTVDGLTEAEYQFHLEREIEADRIKDAAATGLDDRLVRNLTAWLQRSGWVRDYEHARAEAEAFASYYARFGRNPAPK